MGTEFRIVLYTPDEPSATAAAHAAFQRIGQLDAMLSDYREDSELMRLSRQSGGPAVRVSEELFFVLSRARELSERSDGAFDVTIGPVVRLWRRARRQRRMPDAERLRQARELVGYDKMRLDPDARTVQLLKPGMQLDVGGIAKGYAGDEAIAVLKRHGITRALVAGSGDIVVSSPPPGERGWTIGIAPLAPPLPRGEGRGEGGSPSDVRNGPHPNPLPEGEGISQTPTRSLSLADAAVSTSGDSTQFVELNGTRYSHIVDPKTGMGLTEHSSVTVVAPNGISADGLATAVCVLGPERGIPLVESTAGAAAIFVRASADGLETFESSRFKDIPRGQPKSAPGGTR